MGSFTRDEFVFDAGIRALENSGVLFRCSGSSASIWSFLDNPVSIGIGDKIVTIRSERDIAAYQRMLTDLFPEERENIAAIVDVVHRSMTYMDVLYGIDNPLFMDLKHDTAYLKGNAAAVAVSLYRGAWQDQAPERARWSSFWRRSHKTKR
ncbi:MAG: hypothetical protein R2881_08180 [Eubacteriales bacterium]